MGWQPIDTAPRDGTWFEAKSYVHPEWLTMMVRWSAELGRWQGRVCVPNDKVAEVMGGDVFAPTHWRRCKPPLTPDP